MAKRKSDRAPRLVIHHMLEGNYLIWDTKEQTHLIGSWATKDEAEKIIAAGR